MSSPIYTPYGFRDFLFEDSRRRDELEQTLRRFFLENGYRKIETPLVEYQQVFEKERGSVLPQDMYKFVDRDGELLVLRPDMTPALARLAAFYFRSEDLPIRVTSTGNTFRYNSRYSAKQRQLSQTGIELYGLSTPQEDAEVLSLASGALHACGVETYRLTIGHARLVADLLNALHVPEAEQPLWAERIESKNTAALTRDAEKLCLDQKQTGLLRIVTDLGGRHLLIKGKELAGDLGFQTLEQDFVRLLEVDDLLSSSGLSQHLLYDLGMKPELGYYTGIIFKGYAPGASEPVLDGGRYDALMRQFGTEWAAIGFGIYQDSLLKALETQTDLTEAEGSGAGIRPLTFAFTKGRLAKKTLKLLEETGIRCDEIYSDTRKLVFEDPEHSVRFFLAKAGDVPTYVEYGAADIGVVGKDVLQEEHKDIYEVLDLKFGACRMALAGFPEGKDLISSGADFKVATKYPEIARQYFLEKHQMPEILKLGGSIELAPIVGLSDVIVDIVETGSTLKENGLVVLDTVCPVSARLVVNKASMKIRHEEISQLVSEIAKVIDREE